MKTAPRVLVGAALVLALLPTTGCYRYHTRVPGVIDLRTDASQAPKESPPPVTDPALAREGAMGLLLGQGVGVLGSEIHVVNRRYSVLGFIPIINESAAAEVDAAVRLSGALREVSLHEEHSALDWLLGFVGSNVPVVGWIVPPYTFELRGISVRPPSGAVSPPRPEERPAPTRSPAAPPPPVLLDDDETDRLPEEGLR